MIPGTGPGRGLPWWRRVKVLIIWRRGFGVAETPGYAREGRRIAVIEGDTST